MFGNHMGAWGMTLGIILWVLVVVGLVALIVLSARLLLRAAKGESRDVTQPVPRTAREILDERFARGEIDSHEYRERREQLDRD